jgi:hypothetical protein
MKLRQRRGRRGDFVGPAILAVSVALSSLSPTVVR